MKTKKTQNFLKQTEQSKNCENQNFLFQRKSVKKANYMQTNRVRLKKETRIWNPLKNELPKTSCPRHIKKNQAPQAFSNAAFPCNLQLFPMLDSWASGITLTDTLLGDWNKIKVRQVKSAKHLLLPSTLCTNTFRSFFSNSYVSLNSIALKCFSLTFSLLTLIVLSFLKAQRIWSPLTVIWEGLGAGRNQP